MENNFNDINKIESLPYHTHNGINSPKVKVVLTDVLTPQASPANPTGGTVIDVEARNSIDGIIAALNAIGIFI